MADASGTLLSSQGYMPWGETRFGSVGSEYRYTGQYEEADLGLYYYGARWYDPALGRFAQADSIVPEASQGVQAWDRYAGMNNNPVKFNDPNGHDVGCAGKDMTMCYIPMEVKSDNTNPPPYKLTPTMNFPATAIAVIPGQSRPTSTSQVQLKSKPTPTPTRSPTIHPSTTNRSQRFPIEISVDWSKVDRRDLIIDTGGILADSAVIIFTSAGQIEIAATIEVVASGIEVVATADALIEAANGDYLGLVQELLSDQADLVLLAKIGRPFPIVGMFGSGYSLWKNLNPQIQIGK